MAKKKSKRKLKSNSEESVLESSEFTGLAL